MIHQVKRISKSLYDPSSHTNVHISVWFIQSQECLCQCMIHQVMRMSKSVNDSSSHTNVYVSIYVSRHIILEKSWGKWSWMNWKCGNCKNRITKMYQRILCEGSQRENQVKWDFYLSIGLWPVTKGLWTRDHYRWTVINIQSSIR